MCEHGFVCMCLSVLVYDWVSACPPLCTCPVFLFEWVTAYRWVLMGMIMLNDEVPLTDPCGSMWAGLSGISKLWNDESLLFWLSLTMWREKVLCCSFYLLIFMAKKRQLGQHNTVVLDRSRDILKSSSTFNWSWTHTWIHLRTVEPDAVMVVWSGITFA